MSQLWTLRAGWNPDLYGAGGPLRQPGARKTRPKENDVALMARPEQGSATYNPKFPESIYSAEAGKSRWADLAGAPASGRRLGSALNSPSMCSDRAENSKVALTFSLAQSPRLPESFPSILSLSSDSRSQSARYVPLRAGDAGGSRPDPSRCRLPASLRHRAAMRLELAAASAVGPGGV